MQASSQPSCPTCEPSGLLTIKIMKSVRFRYILSLFVNYYFLILKLIKLPSFGPSCSSNCMDGLLTEKDNIILTTRTEKVEWCLLKIRLKVY